MSIKNRYEFIALVQARNCNPNGDPDMDNMPRMHQDTGIGYMTSESITHHIREYLRAAHDGEPGMNIHVKRETNLNCERAEAKELAGQELGDQTTAAINAARLKMCELYYDVRTFGGVMASGPNAGQVRGPVRIGNADSLDPIHPESVCLALCASSDNVKGAKTAADYRTAEAAADKDKLRSMGRKYIVPFALYRIHGFISANEAGKTGFDETDLDYLFEAVANAFDTQHTSSKNLTVVGPVIIFRHVGEPELPEPGRSNRARLGCAQSQTLFDLVKCQKKDGVDVPASVDDYVCSINLSELPRGIEVGFRAPFALETMWGQLPAGEKWMQTT